MWTVSWAGTTISGFWVSIPRTFTSYLGYWNSQPHWKAVTLTVTGSPLDVTASTSFSVKKVKPNRTSTITTGTIV